MLTKRFIALFRLLAVLVVSLGIASAQDEKLIVAGFSSSPEEDAMLTSLLEQFTEETGIEAEFIPSPDFTTTMQTAFASGEYANVFYIDSSKLPDWVEAGVVAVAEGELENPEGFYPSLVNTFTYDGVLYCAPKDYSTLALQYNKDLFDAAGLEYPTPEWTWDDLMTAAAALTDKDANVVGLVTPPDLNRWMPFLYQEGGAIFDEEGNYVMDSDAAKTSLEYYISFSTSGAGGTADSVDAGWGGEAFGKGNAAMVMEGNWSINFLLQNYPELNWGVTELPSGSAGKATMAFTVCFAVGAENNNPEGSWQLVNFLTGEAGQMKTAEVTFGPMPSRDSAAQTYLERWEEPAKGTKFNAADVEAFVAGAEYAYPWQLPLGFQPFIDAFNSSLQKAMAGEMTADDVLAEAKAAAEEIMSQAE